MGDAAKFGFVVLLYAVFSVLLSSCATVSVSEIPPAYQVPVTKFAVTSVEASSRMTVGLGGAGSAFGLLGGLVESGATATSREALRRKLVDAVGDWSPEDVIRDAFVSGLEQRKRKVAGNGQVVSLPPALAGQSPDNDSIGRIATLWYNPETSVLDHRALIQTEHPDVILEVGYQGYEVSDSGKLGWFLNVTVFAKAVAGGSGEVVGRSRNYIVAAQNGRGIIGKYDIHDSAQMVQFIARFKSVFAKEVKILSDQALDALGL